MSLYGKNTDINKFVPTNPLGLRRMCLRPGELPDLTLPLRFSKKNISVNGNYPGRFVVGDYDEISMVPPNMIPPEDPNWP